jgi:hypothetical protein
MNTNQRKALQISKGFMPWLKIVRFAEKSQFLIPSEEIEHQMNLSFPLIFIIYGQAERLD